MVKLTLSIKKFLYPSKVFFIYSFMSEVRVRYWLVKNFESCKISIFIYHLKKFGHPVLSHDQIIFAIDRIWLYEKAIKSYYRVCFLFSQKCKFLCFWVFPETGRVLKIKKSIRKLSNLPDNAGKISFKDIKWSN